MYLEKVQGCSNTAQHLTREFTSKYEELLASVEKTNKKNFGKYALIQKPGRYSVIELSVNKSTITNPEDTVYAIFPGNIPLPEMLEYNIEKPMQIITIKYMYVELQLRRLNLHKTVGFNGVHPQTLKEAHLEIPLPLTKLLQKSLDTK